MKPSIWNSCPKHSSKEKLIESYLKDNTINSKYNNLIPIKNPKHIRLMNYNICLWNTIYEKDNLYEISKIIIDTNPELEISYIQEYDSYKNGLNSNLGGGGVIKHNKDTRKLISVAGKKNKGKRVSSQWKGKKRSEKMKLKLSQSKKGKPLPSNNKPILQFDKNGNFIREHKSIEQAATYIKGNPTAISNALRKGGGATSSSYIWKYKNNNIK